MAYEEATPLDVAVIGGGPAGISACLELAKSNSLGVALFESQAQLGGMPQTCHYGFGMRDRKRFYTGPGYAKRLRSLVQQSDINICTDTTVVNIIPGSKEEPHRIKTTTKDGFKLYETRFILLSTGCYEDARPERLIPCKRPAGIYTVGQLQQMVNAQHLQPGRRALIIGSEHVALSCVLTLRRSGTSIAGMVEEDPELQTYASVAIPMSFFFRFPIYKNTIVDEVLGLERVEGVNLVTKGNEESFKVECDTVIITGKFRPISLLLDDIAIEQDPLSRGPVVDRNFMTSIPGIFAAGNVLRGADMNDLCALEGRRAARGILKMLQGSQLEDANAITLKAEPPIRYVVPQKIVPAQMESPIFPWMSPGVSIQLEHTVRKPVIEAWAGNEQIWECSFSKIIARTRTLLPLKKFEWDRVDPKQEIVLKIRGANN